MKPISIRCPHCEGLAHVRTSKGLSRLVRECYLYCKDPECGHSFVAQVVIVRTLSPSASPRPDVHIPLAPPPNLRRRRHANDNRLDLDDVARG